jgi:hypothetical protein
VTKTRIIGPELGMPGIPVHTVYASTAVRMALVHPSAHRPAGARDRVARKLVAGPTVTKRYFEARCAKRREMQDTASGASGRFAECRARGTPTWV